jgi:hypothetical protein
MGMLTCVLCLTTMALPQQPATADPAIPAAARLLPRNVLAAVIVDRPGSRAGELAQTGLAQLLRGGGVPMLPMLLKQLEAAGVDATVQHALLDASIGIAWTGIARDGKPGFAAVIDFGTDDSAAGRIHDLLKQKLAGQPETVDGIAVHVVRSGALPACYLVRAQNAVVMTTDREALLTAARPGPRNPTLAALPAFADEFDNHPDGAPLATLFVRASACAEAIGRMMPAASDTIARVTRELQIDHMQHVLGSVRWSKGTFVERVHVIWPGPQRGLLGAFLGTPGGITRTAASQVPAEAQMVAMGWLDWNTVLNEGLDLAAAISPGTRGAVDNALHDFAMAAGIDIRTELFAHLQGQTGLTWWSEGKAQRFLAWQELKDSKQIAANWRKLAAATGLPLEEFDCNGSPSVRSRQMLANDLQPAATLIDGHLLVASSPAVLAAAIANGHKSQPDAKLLTFIDGLSSTTSWAAWSRDAAQHADPAPGPETLLATSGQQAVWMVDERDVTFETRSALGTLGAIAAAIAIPAAMSQPAPVAHRPAPAHETPRTAPKPSPQPAAGPADPQELQTLAEAEKAGRNLDVAKVKALLISADARIAARAAWLLGHNKANDAVPELCATVQNRDEAEVRIQAMSALERLADPRSLPTAVSTLTDGDRTLRALSASTIGRLRNATGAEPLLAMLSDHGKDTDDKPADVIAALLALNDLNAPNSMLQAASAVGASTKEVSEALTFLFQSHSTSLPPKEEATLLLAVLDHPDAMLRRYAIQRLGELRDPTTAKALEGRLAVETAALQPLLHNSLAEVRGHAEGESNGDALERARSHVSMLTEKITSRWDAMDTMQRGMVLALVVVVGATLMALLLVVARIRRHRRSEASARLAAPSAEYLMGESEPAEAGDELPPQEVEEEPPARPTWARGGRRI